MIIMMNAPTIDQINRVLDKLRQLGLDGHSITSSDKTIITASGDLSACQPELYERMPGVDKVVIVETPYKLASREFQEKNTVVTVGKAHFGGTSTPVIAGPCAIESYNQLYQAGVSVKAAGAVMLRGGAYKPRSSPYSFQGLEKDGLEIIKTVGREVGLPVISEVTDPRKVELIAEHVDMLQIGTRNMQNFVLLKEVALTKKPILLKRGLAATIEEWLMAAEYIMSGGNNQVVLCERGIRTYETYTRNTLDLTAVPVIKHLSHLPVIVDPSHGTGNWRWVSPMAKASVAAGADGLLIEVHPCPEEALSDGPQSLTPGNFTQLMAELNTLTAALGRSL
ncbi:3-deoxy-7-phosphoheptulonate synthase [Sporomusa sp.]|uniref:3-deoxy-7-phosphoheptulonate synthase n=1 Tax=Sporomusa sp. TaxID=2078658 RepID=UPI002C5AED42|nr:3-deoxy-7-phosphoheptulonate synthase [Sporomusa sp.]HWR45264.1 3-deoxy-7-phosphoheptulonate synthase [Sporomusa sp.]